ncbi:MAG: hypothetical protein ACR2PJ_05815 [Pseudomonadales bacterium]
MTDDDDTVLKLVEARAWRIRQAREARRDPQKFIEEGIGKS